MPANKSQHYVPQFYMKLFADENGKFNIFNVENKEKYNNVPYKGQCQKDYFYGKDLVFENKFRDMETKWSPLFTKLINENKINEADVRKLKLFFVLQRERTFAASKYCDEAIKQQIIECCKMICKHEYIVASPRQIEKYAEQKVKEKYNGTSLSIQLAEDYFKYIEDLNVLIVTYNTEETLISSDSPVVSANKFIESNIGYANAGFVSFFPLCKTKIAVMYDAKMYPKYKEKIYVESQNENEVKILNEYQLINAGNIVFGCCDNIHECYSVKVSELRNFNRSRAAVQSVSSNNKKLISHKPRQSIYYCTLSFASLNHDARRIPEIGRDYLPRKRNEEYVERMKIREYTIPQIEKVHGNSTIEEQKEFRRAIKRMNQFAYRYWAKPEPIQVLK